MWELIVFLRAKLGDRKFGQLAYLLALGAVGAGAGAVVILIASGKLNPWTGR